MQVPPEMFATPAQKPNCGDFDPATEYKNGDPGIQQCNMSC